MLKKIKHPVLFQGKLDKKKYFEGWYYKQVTADRKTSLSFIPAVSLNPDDPHSFVQYILVQTDEEELTQTQTGYLPYPVSAFTYFSDPFSVTIASSTFTEKTVSVDLEDEGMHIKGQLTLGDLHPIQRSVLHPNIMGVFAYIPYMQCYHGVISMKHSLEGTVRVNDQDIDFTGGRGYIEKDWGSSFPKRYIWLQSNHFEEPTASLFFSIAHIPFYFTEFEGFICNFVFKDREYRFATYNGSSCRIEEIGDGSVHLLLENKKARLDIQAEIFDGGRLIAPVEGRMKKAIKEGISGTLSVDFEDKVTGESYQDTGGNAGVEIVGYK